MERHDSVAVVFPLPDKRRASYYNYYTDMKWGEAKNYDLCINSSKAGIAGAVELMEAYIRIKESL